MILDKQMEFSNSQAITATAASQNQLDLGPNGPNGSSGGAGKDLPIIVTIDETFTGGTSLAISVRSSNAANMSGAVTHGSSAAIPVANLTVGAPMPYSPEIPENAGRYVDLAYTVVGTMTTGKISARGAASRQNNR